MHEIQKEALSLLWRPIDSILIEAMNQTSSCYVNQTTRLPSACAHHQYDYSSQLIDSVSYRDTFETLFSVSTEDLVRLLISNILYILNKVRLLFYIVWPSEIMFSSLHQVPRYVAEVSRSIKMNKVMLGLITNINAVACLLDVSGFRCRIGSRKLNPDAAR